MKKILFAALCGAALCFPSRAAAEWIADGEARVVVLPPVANVVADGPFPGLHQERRCETDARGRSVCRLVWVEDAPAVRPAPVATILAVAQSVGVAVADGPVLSSRRPGLFPLFPIRQHFRGEFRPIQRLRGGCR